MNDLGWLVGHRFQEAVRREYDWLFVFDKVVSIQAGCLWRLVEDDRMRVTSEDDGHKFGLPAPLDALTELNAALGGALISSIDLHHGTLDLDIRFENKCLLQLISTSAGYEAWVLDRPDGSWAATGQGNLLTFRANDPTGRA